MKTFDHCRQSRRLEEGPYHQGIVRYIRSGKAHRVSRGGIEIHLVPLRAIVSGFARITIAIAIDLARVI